MALSPWCVGTGIRGQKDARGKVGVRGITGKDKTKGKEKWGLGGGGT